MNHTPDSRSSSFPAFRKMLTSRLSLACLSIAVLSTVALGQSQDRPARAMPSTAAMPPKNSAGAGGELAAKPAANPGAVVFAQEPVRLESVGLTLYYPDKSIAQVDSAGRDSNITIVPQDSTWSMIVKTPRFEDPDLTNEHISQTALQVIFESYGISPDLVKDAVKAGDIILEPAAGETLTIGGFDARRWYINVPSLQGKEPIVRGYTIITIARSQYITFELLTPKSQFERVRPIYQTVVGAIKVESNDAIQASRAAAVQAGLELFENVGVTTFREITAARPERWERRYFPSASGNIADEKEVAYRRLRFMMGPRSMIESNPNAARGGGAKGEGFIYQMDARVLGNDKSVIDSRGVYFLSTDREEEAWILRTAVRSGPGAEPQVGSELGARTGTSMAITTEATGQGVMNYKPIIQSEGYISQVEGALLPWLLMKNNVETEHGFYSWRSGEYRIMLRKDTVEKIPEQGWKISTQVAEGRTPQVTYYDEKGNMIRSEMSDGSVWEPTTLPELMKIWESKGLPTK